MINSTFNQWVTKWLLTTNHKRIAILYFIFGMFSGVVGTAISVLIRLELAQPKIKRRIKKFYFSVVYQNSVFYNKFFIINWLGIPLRRRLRNSTLSTLFCLFSDHVLYSPFGFFDYTNYTEVGVNTIVVSIFLLFSFLSLLGLSFNFITQNLSIYNVFFIICFSLALSSTPFFWFSYYRASYKVNFFVGPLADFQTWGSFVFLVFPLLLLLSSFLIYIFLMKKYSNICKFLLCMNHFFWGLVCSLLMLYVFNLEWALNSDEVFNFAKIGIFVVSIYRLWEYDILYNIVSSDFLRLGVDICSDRIHYIVNLSENSIINTRQLVAVYFKEYISARPDGLSNDIDTELKLTGILYKLGSIWSCFTSFLKGNIGVIVKTSTVVVLSFLGYKIWLGAANNIDLYSTYIDRLALVERRYGRCITPLQSLYTDSGSSPAERPYFKFHHFTGQLRDGISIFPERVHSHAFQSYFEYLEESMSPLEAAMCQLPRNLVIFSDCPAELVNRAEVANFETIYFLTYLIGLVM